MNLHEQAMAILKAAIEAVKPDLLIGKQMHQDKTRLFICGHEIDLSTIHRIFVIGAGKASGLMAQALEKLLGDHITEGVVVVKYHHRVPCTRIRVLEGGHPIIDGNGLSASEAVLEVAKKADKNDLVICLISGGGSALLEKLPPDVNLSDLQEATQLLLQSGANIEEINTLRKHVSLIKGGQLAKAVAPARCVSLILSDVIGDSPEAIASGPTAADPTRFQDAWEVIEKYGLQERIPASIQTHIKRGMRGQIAETLKPGDSILKRVMNIIIGNNYYALQAAQVTAQKFGYRTLILTSRLQGEAREVARVLASMIQEVYIHGNPLPRPACLLMGGETTVTVRGTGKGGRNLELTLASLLALRNFRASYILMSCGTDGNDGPTDAAGGMASPEIWEKINRAGLNPQSYLKNNDAYHFFEQVGGLIKTGPTGTNVMDVIMALIP